MVVQNIITYSQKQINMNYACTILPCQSEKSLKIPKGITRSR